MLLSQRRADQRHAEKSEDGWTHGLNRLRVTCGVRAA
jgi:hypothetical protein